MDEPAEFQRFANALEMVESTDNPEDWGDKGFAVGRWQIHPAFMDEWAPNLTTDVTWDEWFRMALKAFYIERRPKVSGIITLAMEFHLGVEGVAKGEWDANYHDRFVAEWAKLGSEPAN
jgi:hypothetical protein